MKIFIYLKSLKSLFCIFLILIPMKLFGFWIGAGPIGQVHQGITSEGAKEFTYPISELSPCKERVCTFSDEVIDIFKASNKAIDGGHTKHQADYHCDRDYLISCSR